jgi:hypothetical protein
VKRTIDVQEEEHEAKPHDGKVRILLTFLIQALFFSSLIFDSIFM